ncbi:hypothetical protein [Rhodococcus sp. IEGM 1307]|uniref:hypothetical protein n=1 Tax=Rhodococcus sp. IEGM 1307 TaxID=3047091 RepID=UPI0024B69A47|nr:hypothetical protein [Rhodococcus sp. IEGM 1307]MDI9979594.1 hypothetical protein [Rhodococcus sp. IEGM 1307]
MTLAHTDLDTPILRKAFGQFPSGLVAICAETEGGPVAMTASSFVGVSLELMRVNELEWRDEMPIVFHRGRITRLQALG